MVKSKKIPHLHSRGMVIEGPRFKSGVWPFFLEKEEEKKRKNRRNSAESHFTGPEVQFKIISVVIVS